VGENFYRFWKARFSNSEERKTKINLLFLTKEDVHAFQVFLKALETEEHQLLENLKSCTCIGLNTIIEKLIEDVLCKSFKSFH
jgi:hypothetical protein